MEPDMKRAMEPKDLAENHVDCASVQWAWGPAWDPIAPGFTPTCAS